MIELLPEAREQEAIDLVVRRVGLFSPRSKLKALGFMDSETEELMGAWLFERYTGINGSVFAHWANAVGHRFVTRSNLHLVAHYIFSQLQCQQVLGEVRASDDYVRKMNERLGFKKVAEIPGYFSGDDLVIYRMTRAECSWIPQELKETG